jgi:hypothetical protein
MPLTAAADRPQWGNSNHRQFKHNDKKN